MISDMNEQREKERQARELADQVAALLEQIEDLNAGRVSGQLTVPGARIRRIGNGWTVTD
jgi:hypothetical protein